MADALGVAASIISVLQLAQTIIKYLQEVKDGSESRETLLHEIKSAVKILETLADLDLKSEATLRRWSYTFDLLKTPLGHFSASLSRLERRFMPSKGSTKIKDALKWPFQAAEIKQVINSMERQKTLFILALQRDELLLSAAIANSLDQVKADVETITTGVAQLKASMEQEQTRLNAQENAEIIAWLSPINFWTQQTDTHSRAQQGTGEWLLHHHKFEDWVHGQCETLWCPGMPGAGKTVLASIIIEHLRSKFGAENVGIAWVYFNYNEHASQTAENLISSLLAQLAQRHPIISDEVAKSFRDHRARLTRPSIGEYLKLLQQELLRFTQAYFVIDALDECPTQNRRREKFVSELQRLQPGVRLLFTSRPLHDVRAMMPSAPDLEIRAKDEDVVLYLEGQILQEARLQRHIKDEPSLLSHILAAIPQSVDGMFLMARLHMDSIASLDNRRSVKKALQKLPTTYSELYTKAMERIKCQEPERYVRAFQVLSFLSYALGPLTVSALQHALSIEAGDTELYEDAIPGAEDLVSVCAGLVTIDEGSGIIRFVHYTTRQYFNQLRYTAFPNGQEIIASTCLTYLLYDEFSSQCHTQSETDSRFRKYAFYLYSAEFWALHVINGCLETRLRDRIIAFIEDRKRYSAEEAMLKRRTSVWGYWMTGILTDRSISFIREDPPLHTAAVYGLIETITFLVSEQQYSTELRNRLGQTALHRAAETGQAEVVKTLIELGADSSAIVKHRRLGQARPLHLATHGAHATQGIHLETVRVHLDHGADVNYQEPDHDLTALHIAALMDTDVTKVLLNSGADINAKLSRPSYSHSTAPESGPLTCLHLVMLYAEDRGALERAQLLLTNGVEVNAQTGRGNTALHQAILRPEGFAKLLIEQGADVHIRNNDGRSALQLACERGRLSWLAADDGLDTLAKSMGTASPLHQAIWTQNQTLVVQYLQGGMDPTAKDSDGKTPLDYCVTSGNVELVKLLIDQVESQNLPPAAGSAAFAYAVANMNRFDYTDVETWPKAVQIARLLLPYRTAQHPNDAFDFVHTRVPGTNKTFLILASETNRPAMVEFLLDCGSDVACQDIYGETACHYAAEVNYPEIVQMLVERGSNLDIVDSTGRTPLICALKRGNDAISNNLRGVIANRSQTT